MRNFITSAVIILCLSVTLMCFAVTKRNHDIFFNTYKKMNEEELKTRQVSLSQNYAMSQSIALEQISYVAECQTSQVEQLTFENSFLQSRIQYQDERIKELVNYIESNGLQAPQSGVVK